MGEATSILTICSDIERVYPTVTTRYDCLRQQHALWLPSSVQCHIHDNVVAAAFSSLAKSLGKCRPFIPGLHFFFFLVGVSSHTLFL